MKPALANPRHRDFLAFHLYAAESARLDYIPCRWGTLRDDLKEQWLKIADNKVSDWLDDEEAAKERRESNDPLAFF